MENLSPKAKNGLDKLNSMLPLKDRQDRLDENSRKVHRAFLRTLVEEGRAMTKDDIKLLVNTSDEGAAAIIAELKERDMLVTDCSGQPVGSYPVTTECTPHSVTVNGNKINAMCAFDSLAVSQMFGHEVKIESKCHVSGEPICIEQKESAIIKAEPSEDLYFGIMWNSPTCGCCAHSLCTEMVFIRDKATAEQWQKEDCSVREIYTLAETIPFSAAFFVPLVKD